jgi:hypothetical protein
LPRLYYYGGPEDTQSLSAFFLQKKFSLVSTRFDDIRDVQLDNLVEQPACFISPVSHAEVRRSESQERSLDPLIRDLIHPHRQPVISWRRSSIDGQYLLAGDLEWVDWSESSLVFPNDARLRALNAQAGKVFRSVHRWVSQNWAKNNGFWLGPNAVKLKESGLKTASFHPSKVAVATVFVGQKR